MVPGLDTGWRRWARPRPVGFRSWYLWGAPAADVSAKRERHSSQPGARPFWPRSRRAWAPGRHKGFIGGPTHRPPATSASETFSVQRDRLVRQLLDEGVFHDARVADALRAVPRELFLEQGSRGNAYADRPVPIGWAQTMSAPHMVAIMNEHLALAPGQRVLEIGTGSGYHAAVTAWLVAPTGRVTTVEWVAPLATAARRHLAEARAEHVEVVCRDGGRGAPEAGPFDRVYLTCSSDHVPAPLLGQVVDGGRLLAPVGRDPSRLVAYHRERNGWREEDLGACAFVPLRGEFGV